MTDSYDKLFTQDIINLAHMRARVEKKTDAIDREMAELTREYEMRMQAMQAEKDALLEPVVKAEDDLLELVELYLSRAEDETEKAELRSNISHLIDIRAKTGLEYDDKKALALALALNQKQYIRTKEELDKVKFNKALRDGDINWEGFEYRVEKGVTINISNKLGELLILFPPKDDE